jgi:hypothetical protein
VLAVRGTEPLELSDFQSDFDAVPEAGEPDAVTFQKVAGGVAPVLA